jgi:hypothetical protein
MIDDPVVEEVRRIRQEHAAQFDYDLRAIFADLKQSEKARDQQRSPLLTPAEPSPALQPEETHFARFNR